MHLHIKNSICAIIILASLFFYSVCFAWSYEASGGIGYGPENDQSYDNVGGIADFVFLNKRLDSKLHFLLDTSAAYWQAQVGNENHIIALALSPVFRAYFVNPQTASYRPFLQLAVGPAYISSTTLGEKTQGSHFIFQDRLGVGIEIKEIMVSLQYLHYSNAGIAAPNPGFNIPYVISIGYEF